MGSQHFAAKVLKILLIGVNVLFMVSCVRLLVLHFTRTCIARSLACSFSVCRCWNNVSSKKIRSRNALFAANLVAVIRVCMVSNKHDIFILLMEYT